MDLEKEPELVQVCRRFDVYCSFAAGTPLSHKDYPFGTSFLGNSLQNSGRLRNRHQSPLLEMQGLLLSSAYALGPPGEPFLQPQAHGLPR